MNADRLFWLLLARGGVTIVVFSIPLAITLFPGELATLLHGASDLRLACASILYALGQHLPPLGVAVLALSLLSIGCATLKVARTVARTRAVLGRAGVVDTPPERLARAATVAGVATETVCVDDRRPYAFTAGILRPRIWISRGLVSRLRERELAAVLAHETLHLRRRDPLRLLTARALRAALFAAPWVRELSERYEVAAELDADRAAMRTCGRAALATALWKLSRSGPPFRAAEVAVGGWSLSHARIEQLEGVPAESILTADSRRGRTLSAASLTLAVVLAFGQAARANLVPVSVFYHVIPGAESQVHLCPMPVEGVLL